VDISANGAIRVTYLDAEGHDVRLRSTHADVIVEYLNAGSNGKDVDLDAHGSVRIAAFTYEGGIGQVAAGADLIDIGGESTRPGSRPISAQQEMDRVLPVIEQLRREDEVPISIDTYKAEVARAAVQTGAEIINDISGATFDPQILAVAKEFKTGLVLMHIQGKMETMQIAPAYKDVVEEILIDLAGKVDRALAAGIKDGWLVIDPGIGFGKRWFDNYDILNRLTELRILGLPILIGASRKSFLGKFLSADPQQRLEGSLLANGVAIGNNANIVRVHDVVETQKAVRIADLFYRRAWGVAADILEEQFQ